ncbi:hypothetical protein VHUM_04288 [Vanrija humicola]|uniref:BZIP domain-containing protein n=1 Tax=Vanrija humicola TaxID=5417 RepID=A0A7D8Z1Z4_VANHU|nr:hypothetical protein VHUM_04288 [Vanrija humicola]
MQRAAPLGGGAGGPGGPDDGDNRSRNAKAQRRHREKRKAHLKMLEESVQVLQAQLEEARRQLSNAAYGGGRLAYSPEPKNVGQMAQENAYLRDENADLRRQLYALRAAESGSTSSTSSYPPPLYQFGTIVGEEKGWGQQSISRHPQRASSTSSSRSRMLSTSSVSSGVHPPASKTL